MFLEVQHCKKLFGVDLSTLMIEEAEKKQVYTQLFQEDLFSIPNLDIPCIDLIIAADVLVYIGDLGPRLWNWIDGCNHASTLQKIIWS